MRNNLQYMLSRIAKAILQVVAHGALPLTTLTQTTQTIS